MSLVGRIGAVWKRGERTRADEFVLKDRGRIRGVVVERSSTELVLEVGTGRVTFCLSDIHRVLGGGASTLL
jgi:hypothetical protein